MADCLFCDIVEGRIPCSKVAETENFVAFLDLYPVSEGHTLLVPKKHSTNLLDMPEYLGNELLQLAQDLGQAAIAKLGAEGFNLGLNNGEAAGQSVFHSHFHLIPRKKGDGLQSWPQLQSTPEELSKVQEKLR